MCKVSQNLNRKLGLEWSCRLVSVGVAWKKVEGSEAGPRSDTLHLTLLAMI